MTSDRADRADRLLHRALAALDKLAAAGDGTARHAAALLRGARATRRPVIDDADAVAEIDQLAAAGKRRVAVGIVARKLAATEGISAESVARRLRRRLQNKKRTFQMCPFRHTGKFVQ